MNPTKGRRAEPNKKVPYSFVVLFLSKGEAYAEVRDRKEHIPNSNLKTRKKTPHA
jgi:hypothetical protein